MCKLSNMLMLVTADMFLPFMLYDVPVLLCYDGSNRVPPRVPP